jgi:Zn2+/Cd2+-exporting ATPase
MSKKRKGQIVLISGILILVSYLLKQLAIDPIYENSLMIIASLVAGYSIFKNAFQALRYKIIGIEALVTVAVVGALIIGEYFEAAAVTFLFILGSYLEAKTLEKTRSALKSLMDLAPSMATVVRNQVEQTIPAEEVLVGETVIVKPGGKIPVDGRVLIGEASVNQAAITGESIPVNRKSHDTVFSGTVIESGYLEIEAVKVGSDTSFARILELVEEAQDSKAPTQKFIEKFAKYYTPGIMGLALIVYLITQNIELTLTLLVIACPGALVISTPVSIVAGIGNAAKSGILIKGGEYLEKASKIDIIVFDKTGTLTIGKPVVTKVQAIGIHEDELLRVASSIEQSSEHHLAKAIVNHAKKLEIALVKVQDFKAMSGMGVRGTIHETTYLAGNRKLMEGEGIHLSDEIESTLLREEQDGHTAILVATDQEIIGIISIADQIREEAKGTIQSLKQSGIKKIIMLTGDNQSIAETVGRQIGVDQVIANCLPEDKLSMIKDLQKEYKVAMIGDGVNDAPSLATADLGISMGDVGTDVAIETADVVLLSDQLSKIAYLFALSRATNRNLKQNLSFALFVVFALLIGVLLGQVFMALGMLVHEISVILVIVNAIRLNRFKIKKIK